MSDNKTGKKEYKNQKSLTKASEIKGKLEVSDRRERKDGPGGN